MKTADFIYQVGFIESLRELLGMKPSKREMARRMEIAKVRGWPPLPRLSMKPPPPPAPPIKAMP